MSELILPFSTDYADYLRDESRKMGAAESISFPTSEQEVVEVMREVRLLGSTITTQGARTGIVAGAVPQGGYVLNLSRMNRIGEVHKDDGGGLVTVQPGALLSDVTKVVERDGLFFPPDPTETSASIGGMAACNASGAKTFHYGPTRNWVQKLRVVLADGDVLSLSRGQVFATGREFSLSTERGHKIKGRLPAYTIPNVKSAAGYYVEDDMDMIDLFIGMEGTLGVITEVELRLIHKPAAVNGLTVFLPSENAAISLVRRLRGEGKASAEPPVAIEFFNHDALTLLRRIKSDCPAFENIPALKPHFHSAVYTEFHGESEESVEEPVMELIEAIANLGGSDEDTWFATTERELESLRAFRHSIPEAVNLLIDERRRSYPELTKLGTDMSVPDGRLADVMRIYNDGIAVEGLESVVFGHIGDNHVHVNIIPRTLEEYEKGKTLYMTWALEVVAMGGSVSAEHGIGKIKAPFLRMMYGDDAIAQMRAAKQLFDPEMMLNPGNWF